MTMLLRHRLELWSRVLHHRLHYHRWDYFHFSQPNLSSHLMLSKSQSPERKCNIVLNDQRRMVYVTLMQRKSIPDSVLSGYGCNKIFKLTNSWCTFLFLWIFEIKIHVSLLTMRIYNLSAISHLSKNENDRQISLRMATSFSLSS